MKLRLDEILVKKGLYDTRSSAANAIKDGYIFVDENVQTKPGKMFDENAKIKSRQKERFVGRGAEKLKRALEVFKIDPKNKVVLDAGASTGGFSDLLLQKGAAKVYAVDVGKDQLHEKLKKDPRIINMEQTDIRKAKLSQKPDFAVGDLSFISLRLVVSSILKLLEPGSPVILLFKPQFEVGKELLPKDGVIKDEKIRQKILEEFETWCKEQGYKLRRKTLSPIKGGDGNKEYLLLFEA